MPKYLEPIKHRLAISDDQQFLLGRNYSIQWDGPSQHKLYAVNAGRYSHGISEPQMSLMCWRSATIVNDLLGEEFYDLKDDCSFVEWGNSQQFEPHAHKISA